MFQKELIDLGLSKGEAEIYSVLLRFGLCSATEISKKTDIGRTNVYEYANSLIQKGFITQQEKKSKIFFKAEDPRFLKDLLDVKKRKIKELEITLNDAMPKMETYYSKNNSSPITGFFQGDDGYKQLIEPLFEKTKEKELFVLIPDLDNYEPFPPKYKNVLIRKGILSNIVANSCQKYEEFSRHDQLAFRKTHIVSKQVFEIKTEYLLIEDLIVYGKLSQSEFSVNLLKSTEITIVLKSLLKNILS